METFDIERIKEMLRHFYVLTGIKICLYNYDGVEIAFYPKMHTEFCKYVASSSLGKSLCDRSVCNALEHSKKERKRIEYICDMGLIECVTPLFIKDNIIGYIMFGQTRCNKNIDTNLLKTMSEKCILDYNTLSKYYFELPCKSAEFIRSASEMMDACASYLFHLGLINIDKDNLKLKISSYISEHLNDKLTINGICHTFGISRSSLYSLFKKSFNTSVYEYIIEKRIELAENRLKKTNENISSIATSVGIDNYNYFIRLFKKSKGVTPLQYRKAYQNNNASKLV